ncbi:MAG: hypothetical protein KDF54_04145 [Hydrogenophaga sp.]|nr:hypothetical protein [Hydrogenophaga sp.]
MPGLMVPVHLQMLWSGGFAESLANQGWLAFRANDFGLPEPAPISFGLSGVLPMAALIRLGLALQDAYALTVLVWLAVAFLGAMVLARRLGAHARTAIMLATCWLTLPVVWGHAGYSMLALGIALLPTYLWTALSLLQPGEGGWKRCAAMAPATLVVAMVAVFMDGYTFVMYGVASMILIVTSLLHRDGLHRRLVLGGGAVQTVALVLAYVAYKRYVGELPLDRADLDTFRAYGLDLHYLVVPTQAAHPVFDLLGWSAARSTLNQFGDASVWTTTFALPLLGLGLVAAVATRPWSFVATAAGAIALLAFYLALGPSLKILSTGAVPLQHFIPGLMPAEAGALDTGNAWMYALPGFASMRATYRWLALALLGLWILSAVWMGRRWRNRQVVPVSILAVVIVLQLPDLTTQWNVKHRLRTMFLAMDREVGKDVTELEFHPGERVVFLPAGNDFLANHIAARHRIKTYNIGGDKNLAMARRQWPPSIRSAHSLPGAAMALDVTKILLKGDAEAVVLPHVSLLDASDEWPCQAFSVLNDIEPWTIRGASAGVGLVQWLIPVDPERSPQAVYLLGPTPVHGAAKARLSLYSASVGAVLQQSVPGGGWKNVVEAHISTRREARVLVPVPAACRSSTCEVKLVVSLGDGASVGTDDLIASNIGPECPVPMRETLSPMLEELRADPWLEVRQADYFSVVRLSSSLRTASVVERMEALAETLAFPFHTNQSEKRLGAVLTDGWYEAEQDHIWSKAEASLSLPVPRSCRNTACEVELDFSVLAADAKHPVTVTATHMRTGAVETWIVRSPERFAGRLALDGSSGMDDIRLAVAPAQSPLQGGISQDDRVLGIGLQRIDVRPAAGR